MGKRRYFAALVIVLAGLAFLAGYWPEHHRRQALEGQLTSLRVQLAEAQARVRLGGLPGQILATEDAVSAQDYGQAQTLSSQFFDALRAEAARTTAGSVKGGLEKIAGMCDSVTASLTRADPQALTLLRDAEAHVREALGRSRPTTAHEAAVVALTACDA
jgi:hypothetical protein